LASTSVKPRQGMPCQRVETWEFWPCLRSANLHTLPPGERWESWSFMAGRMSRSQSMSTGSGQRKGALTPRPCIFRAPWNLRRPGWLPFPCRELIGSVEPAGLQVGWSPVSRAPGCTRVAWPRRWVGSVEAARDEQRRLSWVLCRHAKGWRRRVAATAKWPEPRFS